MKIAVNTRLLLKNKLEGIGWFSFETLKRITRQHPEHEFIFLFDRPFDPSFIFSDNIKPIVLFPQARHPWLFYFYFQYSIPYILKKEKIDLFLSPDGFLSLRTDIPQLPVIHDINFEHYPEILPSAISKFYRKYFPLFAQKAKRIATVSEYSKQDLQETYGISADKIDVVYNGASSLFRVVDKNRIQKIRDKISNGQPYIIFVGSLNPRKNIVRLLAAFEKYRLDNNTKIKLVLVGHTMWYNKDLTRQLNKMSFKDDVILTGRLENNNLAEAVSAAELMAFVPLFEGFGIPALEAMQSGVPLIASNCTSLPEVTADAAALVNPENVDEIASVLKTVLENEDIRAKMIKKGLEQAKNFSWDKTAELLWESIEKASHA